MKSWFALACLLATVNCLDAQQSGSPTQAPLPQKTLPAAANSQITAPQPLPGATGAPARQSQAPAAATVNAAPKMPLHVVFRPNFLTADIAHYAGLAFRLRNEATKQDFLVTPHSIFGPAAELKEQMTPDQINKVIVAAIGISINDPFRIVISQKYLGPVDARPADDKGSEGDMAFFALAGGNSQEPSLVLDPAPPIVGDRIWVYVKYPGSQKVGLEGATIAWVSNGELRYHLDNQTISYANTLGAPLLSSDGYVVGMHMGTFKAPSGKIFGYACPGSSMRKVLDSMVPKKAKKSLL